MPLSRINAQSLTDASIVSAEIADGAITTAKLADNAVTTAKVNPTQTDITSVGTLTSFRSTGIDDNADALAMTIDSSENVMVGTTNNNPTSSSVNVAGQSFGTTGGVRSTVDQNPSGTFNRKTDDGQIVLFRKDGTTIGSIGVTSSDQLFLTRATGSQGIKLKNSALMPSNADGSDSDADQDLGSSSVRWQHLYISAGINNGSQAIAFSGGAFAGDGSSNDNAIDLGRTDRRFKDLYLSSGVFLGGTGSANELTDYEEGTWTPSFVGLSNTPVNVANIGRYTKIGNLVHVQFNYQSGGTSPAFSSNTDELKVSGLPFASTGGYYVAGVGAVASQTFNFQGSNNNQGLNGDLVVSAIAGSNIVFKVVTNGANRSNVRNSSITGGAILETSLTYRTT